MHDFGRWRPELRSSSFVRVSGRGPPSRPLTRYGWLMLFRMGLAGAGGTSVHAVPAPFGCATRISVSVCVTPSCQATHGAPPTPVTDGLSDDVDPRRLIG